MLPVAVHVQQEVRGADGESDLVPLAISQAVGEGLGARLAFEAVVVADLLPHAAALQLKVAVEEERNDGTQPCTLKIMYKSLTVEENWT